MHWTYAAFDSTADLEQGDVLAPTPDLSRILEEVHPHFCAPKYLGFLVTTQSCDVVRRPQVKARYLNICAIRSLRDVLPRLLEELIPGVAPGVFKKSQRPRAAEFLTRVLNQNEQANGLYYLHADGSVGLGESCIAFLRVSVALRAQHYDTLVNARRGRLSPAFQAKLGWLVGNLYSRAATPDWDDVEGGDRQLKTIISDALDAGLIQGGPLWLDDDLVAGGRAANVDFTNKNEQELLLQLEAVRPKAAIDKLVDEVALQARKIFGQDERISTLSNRLAQSSVAKNLLKRT